MSQLIENNENVQELDSRDATEIVGDCYKELSQYVTRTRAYASALDGLKAVYRRVIYASRIYNRKVKSASIVGEALKYHPHGDASVYDALVQMTCEYNWFPLFEGKGNFGGMGFAPAAMRYTEAMLSDMAKLMFLELIDYAEYIDGEAGMKEPKYLPALLPYCLLIGAGGIPVGMPVANIPPLNALDLVNYYIDLLEKKPNPVMPIPDFGEIILNCNREEYINPLLTSGQGRLWFNGIVIQEDETKFVVCTATPSCSFWKLKEKVQHWIDQDVLDYTDETDSNGSRHVFTITNPSKLSPKTLKDKLERTMKCSLNYNFIVEYNSGAKQCGINFIIAKNLKYLRECAVRKYQSYSSKSNRQLLVLQAIEDYKKSGHLDEIARMSSDEVKAVIVDLGYTEDIASEAIKKPITYLTKSHAKEIEDLKADIKSYDNYIQNPDEYLLTLYYRLREMMLPIYSKRGHSVILDEMDKIKPKKAKFNAKEQKIVISDSRNGIKWNRTLYLVSDDGTVTSRYVSNRVDNEIDVSLDEHNYSHLVGDNGQYMIIVVAGKHIVVKKLSDLQGSRQRFKPWDGVPVNKVFIVNGPKVKIVDERGNEDEYNLPNWEKSRISYPSKATRYDIKDIYDI